MLLLLKATENSADIVKLGGRFQMPRVKQFMDDITILTSRESTIHKILNQMDKQIIWCRIKSKPKSLEVSRLGKEKCIKI